MKIFEQNPLTERLHNYWRFKIKEKFNFLDFSDGADYLILINYVIKSPQKFYSVCAFNSFLDALNSMKFNNPKLLAQVLLDSENQISLANKVLNDINLLSIHDVNFPSEHDSLINFIDKNIHYNLLKLYEVPLLYFTKVLSSYWWLTEGKKLEGLVLSNSVKELKSHGFEFLNQSYLHDVRNGIAHGKIVFTDSDISYFDKQNQSVTLPVKRIVEVFDETVDIVNAFCLAYKVFCLQSTTFLNDHDILIPQSILLEELQLRTNGPSWEIYNILDSKALGNKKQLMIYIKNGNWDFEKVRLFALSTAYWAEKLTFSYNRIFLSLHSKHSKTSPIGWAAYDADKLRDLRKGVNNHLIDYKDIIESLIFFIPKFKFPRLFYKIGNITIATKILMPIMLEQFLETYRPNPFFLRDTKIHSKKYFTVIENASIVIKPQFQGDIQELIRSKRKEIIKLAIKKSKSTVGIFSRESLYPVRYNRVFVFSKNKRLRQLRNSGLHEDVICSIEVNATRRIRTIDIIGSTAEQMGKYRIVWNKKWLLKHVH